VSVGKLVLAGAFALVILVPLGYLTIPQDGANAAASGELRPDAPVPAQFRDVVTRAGHLCPGVTPAALAAQIEVESAWNPNAYTDSGEAPAKGIAQFTDATWQTWGADYDQDGVSSPYDPHDAIMAMGHLMCDLVRWAEQHVRDGTLAGDIHDLAWAAYHGGRATILRYGGVPPAAAAPLTHDYPRKVRDRIPKYAWSPGSAGLDGWVLPLPTGHHVSSGFGPRGGRMHYGVDVMAPTGTPIYAAAAGTVVASGCDSAYCDRPGNPGLGGCGNYVKLQHRGNVGTMYCHMVERAVSVGDTVAAGQVIGFVGSTGNSSGPHLHFQVHLTPPFSNESAVDPVAFLRSVGLEFK